MSRPGVVPCACADESSKRLAKQEQLTAAQTHHVMVSRSARTSNLPPDNDKKNRPRLSLCSRLGDLLSRPLDRNVTALVCAHGTTIPLIRKCPSAKYFVPRTVQYDRFGLRRSVGSWLHRDVRFQEDCELPY